MLLEHVKNINFVDEELETEMAELTETINNLLTQLNEDLPMGSSQMEPSMPEPGMADQAVRGQDGASSDEIVSAMELIVKQMDAAKRGMAILNKMGDSPHRTKNRSRVMGNLNKIRGSLQRVTKMMDMSA